MTSWQVLEWWNIAFHINECFNHPNLHVALGKVPHPPFLEAFPFIKQHIRDFCLLDLANLSIDKVQNYVISTAVPKCMMRDGISIKEKDMFLNCYGLETIHL